MSPPRVFDLDDAQPSLTLDRYWFGVASDDLRNLATCIWRSKEDASRGSVGPDHKKAVQAVRTLYSEWKIDQHRLVIRDGASSWEITRWDG